MMEVKEIHDKIDAIDGKVANIDIAINAVKEALHDIVTELNILQAGFSETQPIIFTDNEIVDQIGDEEEPGLIKRTEYDGVFRGERGHLIG
jgi:regulator of replication initiation timing